MRALAALAAGIVAAVVAMMLVGLVQAFVAPMPGGARTDTVLASLASGPLLPQVFVLLSWFAAAFAGAAVAKRIAGVSWPGWTIAGVLALLLATAFLMPLPVWMQVLAVVGPLAGGLLADLLIAAREIEVEEDLPAPEANP